MVVSVKKAWVLASLGLAASTACGGISTRHVGDNESGSGGDVETGGIGSGGRGAGGKGSGGSTTGVGGVGADGGSFTAGGVGGVGGAGGDFAGGVGASGGVSATGGVGATGVGAGPNTGGFGGVGVGGVGAAAGAFSTGGSLPVAGAPADVFPLPWEDNGYIQPGRNDLILEGSFYFSTDCASAATANLPCTKGDPNYIGPDGQTGWALSEVVACARGSVTQVINNPMTGMPAYDLQWGALLGVGMWDLGRDAFDARSRGIIGFEFDLIGVAPPDLRVNIVTPETIGVSHFVSTIVPSPGLRVLFEEAVQGTWVTMPVPLDTSRISGLELHAYTNASSESPFDFCIMNLRAITR